METDLLACVYSYIATNLIALCLYVHSIWLVEFTDDKGHRVERTKKIIAVEGDSQLELISLQLYQLSVSFLFYLFISRVKV